VLQNGLVVNVELHLQSMPVCETCNILHRRRKYTPCIIGQFPGEHRRGIRKSLDDLVRVVLEDAYDSLVREELAMLLCVAKLPNIRVYPT
jgi:hypothetical protein